MLRAAYEILEGRQDLNKALESGEGSEGFELSELCKKRSWSKRDVVQLLREASRRGELTAHGAESYSLSPLGIKEAAVVVRNHRLWELYLINYADIASANVDRSADRIEHVLPNSIIASLEAALGTSVGKEVPHSPHEIASQE